MSEFLAGVLAAVRDLAVAGDDAARVDQIRALEELKAIAAATQARVTAEFVDSQRQGQRDAGVRAERAERGIASQVGLAKRCSPHVAARFVGWAKVLTTELPETFAALQRGEITEYRATLLARETIFLSREHRALVDAELGPRAEKLGDKRIAAEARKLAYELDPAGYVERQRAAEKDRRVTLQPAPDTMSRLTALLPVTDGVSAYATLGRDADALIAAGDPRTRGQLMADLLTERLTGRAVAAGSPVEVSLVISTDTLLEGGDEAAHLDGIGPVPAPAAREMVLGGQAPVWLRRVFTAPGYRRTRRGRGEAPAVHSRATPLDHTPRPALPHPLVRSADQTHRPRPTQRARRRNEYRQRPGPVRSLQLRETSARLAGQARTRRHHHDNHPDRASLPQPTTATTGTITRFAARADHDRPHVGGVSRRDDG